MGFPLRPTGGGEHEERAEDLDSSQGIRDHLVAYHLVLVNTDFILDENRVCCNNDLEQTLMLLHTRGMTTTRHKSLVERGGRKALLKTLHTHKTKNVRKNQYSRICRKD